MTCNPTVTVNYGNQTMSAEAYQRFCDATARISKERLPEQTCDAVRKIVAVRGIEPRPGFIQNELSVSLHGGIEVSVEGRGRGKGIAIVRVNGQIVAHEFHGTFESGEWQRELSRELEAIWHDEMYALADKGCVYCSGYGAILDEGDYIACECTERKPDTSFAVHHGANRSQTIINEKAEEKAA